MTKMQCIFLSKKKKKCNVYCTYIVPLGSSKIVQIYIYIKYVKLRENLIIFQIEIKIESNFTPCVQFNLNFEIFVPSKLIQCKN